MFKTVYYTVHTSKPLGGSGSLTFALISDLHRQRWGARQELLMDALAREAPDALLLCGDIFHHEEPFDGSELFVTEAAGRYPCYYVSGNHEERSEFEPQMRQFLLAAGVTLLEGDSAVFEACGSKVNICGVRGQEHVELPTLRCQLRQASEAAEEGLFTILLVHRPEWVSEYLPYDFDLILCGHTHGGQWRIPRLLNGLYAPGQGFFPEYAGGRYDFKRCTMIVGRGLVQSGYGVPRIFNPPELPIITVCHA